MKKYILIPMMMFTALVVITISASAQKKCSDKPIAVEFRKVREKQEARKQMLQKTQQDPLPSTSGTTTTPQQTKQQPNNKPSTQPMSIPGRKRQ